MDQAVPDNKQTKLDELYEYGRSKGILTYKEIMDRLMELEMDPDQLDKVLETLEAYGISVVNDADEVQDAEAAEAEAAAEAASRSGDSEKEISIEEQLDLSVPEGIAIDVMVNSKMVHLTGKKSYIYVDVFDHIDFDLSKPQGKGVKTLLNGKDAQYTEVLKTGDKLDIYWEQ